MQVQLQVQVEGEVGPTPTATPTPGAASPLASSLSAPGMPEMGSAASAFGAATVVERAGFGMEDTLHFLTHK